ncbi:hypothetical protein Droror1_Dr00014496 [Drosera rotundifolia]
MLSPLTLTSPRPPPLHSLHLTLSPLLPPLPPRSRRRRALSHLRRNLAVKSGDSNPSSSLNSSLLSEWRGAVIRLSASSLFWLSLAAFAFSLSTSPRVSASPGPLAPTVASLAPVLDEEDRVEDKELGATNSKIPDNKDLDEAFEKWESKTFALTVPLSVVALRDSVPPSWIKDFVQSQGNRLKFRLEVRADLAGIHNDLVESIKHDKINQRSTVNADLITVGDSWLNYAIKYSIIERIKITEKEDWFKALPQAWKLYLRRNEEGLLDSEGSIWGIPYRWGSMVIMYKKNKFDKYGLQPIRDWKDLWRPELAGKIAMVNSGREIVGAVLKHMGASYNTKNIDIEVPGGINAVQQNLTLLAKQVRLFDSVHYLKAFSAGDVWVAVGWSSDVLPAARRSSDVAVIVPESGTSLWADLWAVPSTPKSVTSEFGGRIRGPSPLIHQWLDFCLQPARELPFKQGVIPGASPLSFRHPSIDASKELIKGSPKLETNLIAGVPPPEILSRCEFLEPLPDSTLAEYSCLISSLQRPCESGWEKILDSVFAIAKAVANPAGTFGWESR